MGIDLELAVPYEVIGDIFMYLKPHRIHAIARYAKQGRYIINNYMSRCRYIDKWVGYGCWKMELNGNVEDGEEHRIEYCLANYWYYGLILPLKRQGELLAIIGSIRDKRLYLYIRNSEIEDVSPLADIYALDLTYCNIKDISVLGNVHTLCLCMCHYSIDNIGSLANVHTLDLSDSIFRYNDLSKLGSVHKLHLSGIAIGDEDLDICSGALSNVHTLDLSFCRNITEISIGKLGTVHTIELGCRDLTPECVNALCNVHKLITQP